MKKISVILLLLVICLGHLNIADAVLHFSGISKKNNSIEKNVSENGENEKETKGKEKVVEEDEDENFYSFNEVFLYNYSLAKNNKEFFICNVCINIHPFTEDDLQPPRLA